MLQSNPQKLGQYFLVYQGFWNEKIDINLGFSNRYAKVHHHTKTIWEGDSYIIWNIIFGMGNTISAENQ